MAHLIEEGYRPDPTHISPNTGNQMERRQFPRKFTDKIEVEARPPDKYVRTLTIPTNAQRGRGGRGGGRGPGGGFGQGGFPADDGGDGQ